MFLFDDYDLPVELVLMPKEEIIVKFPNGLNGRPQFEKKFQLFEKEMKKMGILVEGSPIFPVSKNFGKAFYETYFRYYLDQNKFRWHKI